MFNNFIHRHFETNEALASGTSHAESTKMKDCQNSA